MPDPIEDPEASLIRKVTPLFVKFLPLLAAALLGATGGAASHSVGDANQTAVVQDNRNEILVLKTEIGRLTDALIQEEKEREDYIRRLERRLTWLEAKLDIAAPPAPSRRN